MPGFKFGNPGCECCDEGCDRYLQTFATDGGIVGFTVTSGAASQSSGWGVLDPSTVMYCTTTGGRVHHVMKSDFRLDADDTYIEFRIGWDRTGTGYYYFGRAYSSTSSLDSGKIELGIYTGSETIYQGPFYVFGLDKDKTHTGSLCYDGINLSFRVTTADGETDTVAVHQDDFTATGGEEVGFATGTGGTQYKIDNFDLDMKTDDPDDSEAVFCWYCPQCTQDDYNAAEGDIDDEWDVASGTTEHSLAPVYTGVNLDGLTFDGATRLMRRQTFVTQAYWNFTFSWTFYISDPDEPSNGNECDVLFWWEDSNNYWYVRVAHNTPLAIVQVSGGASTTHEESDWLFDWNEFDDLSGYLFTVEIVVRDDDVVVNVTSESPSFQFYFIYRTPHVRIGWENITSPATWQVGFKANQSLTNNRVALLEYSHTCNLSSTHCERMTDDTEPQAFQAELVGAPCPFHNFNGTYTLSTQFIDADEVDEPGSYCRYSVKETDENDDVIATTTFTIPINQTYHPSDTSQTGELGTLFSVVFRRYVFEPYWPFEFPVWWDLQDREDALDEFCGTGGTGITGQQNDGKFRWLELKFYKWIAASQMPINGSTVDWYIYLDDIYSILNCGVPGCFDWSHPGRDFSNTKLRLRSVPLP